MKQPCVSFAVRSCWKQDGKCNHDSTSYCASKTSRQAGLLSSGESKVLMS